MKNTEDKEMKVKNEVTLLQIRDKCFPQGKNKAQSFLTFNKWLFNVSFSCKVI